MGIPMGMGRLGDQGLVHKRKFRWTFRVEDICEGKTIPEHFVKLAARPNLSIEETEINFLNAKTWVPGKGTWETVTVTYYDVGGDVNADDVQNLWAWLATVYEFTNSAGVPASGVGPVLPANVSLRQASRRQDYAGRGVLKLYDGCGGEMEEWIMRDMWPQAVNFGDLDYSSSEEMTIELTLRYSSVNYTPRCPGFGINPCCTEC